MSASANQKPSSPGKLVAWEQLSPYICIRSKCLSNHSSSPPQPMHTGAYGEYFWNSQSKLDQRVLSLSFATITLRVVYTFLEEIIYLLIKLDQNQGMLWSNLKPLLSKCRPSFIKARRPTKFTYLSCEKSTLTLKKSSSYPLWTWTKGQPSLSLIW